MELSAEFAADMSHNTAARNDKGHDIPCVEMLWAIKKVQNILLRICN